MDVFWGLEYGSINMCTEFEHYWLNSQQNKLVTNKMAVAQIRMVINMILWFVLNPGIVHENILRVQAHPIQIKLLL